jgi:hypothetical protein
MLETLAVFYPESVSHAAGIARVSTQQYTVRNALTHSITPTRSNKDCDDRGAAPLASMKGDIIAAVEMTSNYKTSTYSSPANRKTLHWLRV